MNSEQSNIQITFNMTPEEIDEQWAKTNPSEWVNSLALEDFWNSREIDELISIVKVLPGGRRLDVEFDADCAWAIKNIYEDGLESEKKWRSLFSRNDPEAIVLRAFNAYRAYHSYSAVNTEIMSRERFYK